MASSLTLFFCVLGPGLVVGMDESYFDHAGAPETQLGRKEGDPDYYQTNSGLPILPTMHGFMGTHGTASLLLLLLLLLSL